MALNLGRFTIGKKIGLGYAAMIILVSGITVLTNQRLSTIDQLNRSVTTERYPSVVACWQVTSHLNEAAAALTSRVLLANDPVQTQALKKDETTAWQSINDSIASLQKLQGTFSKDDKDQLLAANAGITALQQVYQQVDALADSHSKADLAQAVDLINTQATPYARAITDGLDKLLASQEKSEVEDSANVHKDIRTANSQLMFADILVILLGVFLAVLISRRISIAIRKLVTRTEAIAAGELTGDTLASDGDDEIGDLTHGINQMQSNLRTMIESVVTTTERVASASEEISANATEQAQGAELQKDQTHQVATAMQEMSATVMQVSENSNRAAEASLQAANTARRGGGIVDQTLIKMRTIAETVGATALKVQELGKSSDQIGEIIGVIDDIADQTNLLALNAAIEAARAGEQGRGFAVVADEVRKLAERTTKATKEIAMMIKNIQSETQSAVEAMFAGNRQVDEGVATTTEAGNALRDIIEMAERVGEMITHIAAASTQQSGATEEVNANIEQISRITMDAASGAQQSARACQELSNLALDLQNLVSQFKLSHHGGSETKHPFGGFSEFSAAAR